MSSETRELAPAALARLETLIILAGGRQLVAARMAVANGIVNPSKEEVDAQLQRLRRAFGSGKATIKSLILVAAALARPLPEFLAEMLAEPGPSRTPAVSIPTSDDGTAPVHDNGPSLGFAPDSETGQLYRRLNKASELTTRRINVANRYLQPG